MRLHKPSITSCIVSNLASMVATIDLDRDISSLKLGKKVFKHEAASPIDGPFAFEGHAKATEDFGERFFRAARVRHRRNGRAGICASLEEHRL